jgi:UV DNA damage repair endonuclease
LPPAAGSITKYAAALGARPKSAAAGEVRGLRIGWCCKWVASDGDPVATEALNLRSTTATALAKLAPAAATERLLGLVRANMAALQAQIAFAAARPEVERCMRIGSNLLPLYTHPVARPLYAGEATLREAASRGLAAAGRLAVSAGVRLSMHPGPFTVLATASESALRGTIEEIEYHAEVMRGLGLAGGWHPHGAHINVHAGAKAPGVETFRANLALLSGDARGLLTVENDETAYALEELLPLAHALPIVIDLHHHWIRSGGEHIVPDDPRIAVVRRSWRGVRPMAHLSAPRRELMPDWPEDRLPDFAALVAAGVPARDLRAHSDGMWNRALNAFAAAHLAWADLEIEAKDKNLASAEFAEGLGAATA